MIKHLGGNLLIMAVAWRTLGIQIINNSMHRQVYLIAKNGRHALVIDNGLSNEWYYVSRCFGVRKCPVLAVIS